MATLEDALQGLNYTGADTTYGDVATVLGQIAPKMITPYSSTGESLGIGLGSILLQSLLGYQARQQAARDTLELNTLANQLMTKTTPEARTEFIKGVSEPGYQSRLSTLSTALMQQEAANKIQQAQKLADLTTAAEFEMGPLGTALAARKTQQAMDIAAAGRTKLEGEKPKKDWFQTIPAEQRSAIAAASGSIESIKNLANQFRALGDTGVELGLKQYIPGSAQDLAMTQFSTMVPGIAKLLGQLGNLNIYEQQVLDDSLKGRSLSGSESIAKRLDQLAELTQRKIVETTETYKAAAEGGGEAVLQKLMGGASAPQDKMQKLQQLQAQLAELKRMRAAAGK